MNEGSIFFETNLYCDFFFLMFFSCSRRISVTLELSYLTDLTYSISRMRSLRYEPACQVIRLSEMGSS